MLMIFNVRMQKASLLAFCSLLVGSIHAASNQPIESRICDDKGFVKTRLGDFVEIIKDADTVYAYRVSAEELLASGLKGHDVSTAARSYALREFTRAYSKAVSPPSESAVLVTRGVQSIAKKCPSYTAIFFWVPRSQLHWEISQPSSGTGDVMEQAKRMIDAAPANSPQQPASGGTAGFQTVSPPRSPGTGNPKAFIESD